MKPNQQKEIAKTLERIENTEKAIQANTNSKISTEHAIRSLQQKPADIKEIVFLQELRKQALEYYDARLQELETRLEELKNLA